MIALDAVMSEARALRVLLVEDDPDFRVIVQDVLRDARFDVVSVGDGREAVEALGLGRFDVVLTDLRLPGVDGLEVVRAARAAPGAPAAVVMTAFPSWKVDEDARRAGAARVLSKPIMLRQLEGILRAAEGGSRG